MAFSRLAAKLSRLFLGAFRTLISDLSLSGLRFSLKKVCTQFRSLPRLAAFFAGRVAILFGGHRSIRPKVSQDQQTMAYLRLGGAFHKGLRMRGFLWVCIIVRRKMWRNGFSRVDERCEIKEKPPDAAVAQW
ncbi:MAG: hypothetical protein QM744_15965 [Mesorhizobium sp.]